MSSASELIQSAHAEGFRPDPVMLCSEWADRYRQLTRETSAEPGQWRTSRAPYQREPMDMMSPSSRARRVVLMWGAQLGKTDIMLNAIGMRIHLVPGPMMLVLPVVDAARNFSKERIGPLVSATPEIAARVLENRSRDGDNTLFVKRFTGGFLKLTGANSAAGLRSTPIRDLYCDEVDAYPRDVDNEGDPVGLAEARTSNFPRGMKAYTSTPGVKGLSRIESEFQLSDQRRFFVPCPHCGHMDHMRWSNLHYEDDSPATASLRCDACGVLIEERWKTQMLEQGEWRPTASGDGTRVGYHLSSLYSPLGWFSWADLVSEWLEAKRDVLKLKKFVNTRLAETWEERSESVDAVGLLARREAYETEVPAGVGALVGAVDVQDDRLEWKVVGYGAAEESWLIAAAAELGNPAHDDVWLRLDAILRRTWKHASGQELRLECVAVDSGGHHTEQVYRFCKARADRRIFAVKGSSLTGLPLLGRATVNNSFRARLYLVCTDTAKEMIYARLRIQTPGPGYMHLPDWVDDEYVEQLTAEKVVRHFPRGRPSYREWVKTRARNEALDLEVYCLAALRIRFGPQPAKALAAAAAFAESPIASASEAHGKRDAQTGKSSSDGARTARRAGWLRSWRR